MMRPARHAPFAAVLTCAVATAAPALHAQPSAEAAPGLDACARIEASTARLDCYDELARRVAPAAERPKPASENATPQRAEARPAVPVAAPPTPAALPQRPSRREARAADREAREFTDRVAAIREIQPGRLEVTLASGQVWWQTNSDRYELLPGHEVRLYPSGFGQYFRLSAVDLRGFIQVERVR